MGESLAGAGVTGHHPGWVMRAHPSPGQPWPVSGESERWPPVLRPIVKRQITPRGAALVIAAFTVFFAVAGGLLAWGLDRDDFPTAGDGLWWSLQTVTTVGYGDIVPHKTEG